MDSWGRTGRPARERGAICENLPFTIYHSPFSGAGSADLSEEVAVEEAKAPSLSKDLQTLVKARLNVFVLITTFFGYAIARKGLAWDGMLLLHLVLGTGACAFAAAVFNQLAEVDSDAMMKRTADRPLPAKRMTVVFAFAVGWGLAAFGMLHLFRMVGIVPGWIAAATIAIYVFAYTPMKKWTSTNTLMGGIPGALPPLIGWVGGGGDLWAWGGWYLFALLFLWQLPHFVAINWLCREEYEIAGYQMWSNGDVSGKRSVRLAVWFVAGLAVLALLAPLTGLSGWGFAVVGVGMAAVLAWSGRKFLASGERTEFRRFFLLTLVYLPVVLGGLWLFWRP